MECPECRRVFNNQRGICPFCTDSYRSIEAESLTTLREGDYAGPILRSVAFVIDLSIIALFHFATVRIATLLLGTSALEIFYPSLAISEEKKVPTMLAVNAWFLLVVVPSWLYFAILESSRWQGTIGKRIMGIGVTDMNSNRISFLTATFRYFFTSGVAGAVGGLMTKLGPYAIASYVMAFGNMSIDEKHQGAHDRFTHTLVLREREVKITQIMFGILFAFIAVATAVYLYWHGDLDFRPKVNNYYDYE